MQLINRISLYRPWQHPPRVRVRLGSFQLEEEKAHSSDLLVCVPPCLLCLSLYSTFAKWFDIAELNERLIKLFVPFAFPLSFSPFLSSHSPHSRRLETGPSSGLVLLRIEREKRDGVRLLNWNENLTTKWLRRLAWSWYRELEAGIRQSVSEQKRESKRLRLRKPRRLLLLVQGHFIHTSHILPCHWYNQSFIHLFKLSFFFPFLSILHSLAFPPHPKLLGNALVDWKVIKKRDSRDKELFHLFFSLHGILLSFLLLRYPPVFPTVFKRYCVYIQFITINCRAVPCLRSSSRCILIEHIPRPTLFLPLAFDHRVHRRCSILPRSHDYISSSSSNY